MDLRCSGKDLIGNHLTMSLYHHAAVWNYNEDMMTKGYFCNGYILVDGEKMAKHKGNFLTLEYIIEKYGCDASRIALADCGDSLDDANFVREVADKSINKLFSFENFVKILINEYWNKNPDFKIENPEVSKVYTDDFDKIFDNNINYLIEEAKNSYEEMKYKNVLKFAFYGMINSKDEYILFNNDDYSKLNPTLMVHFLKTFFIIINPILPHWTEYMYRTYLNPIFEKFGFNELKIEFLAFAKYPQISNPVDKKLFDYNNYINKVIESIRESILKKAKNKNKGKKNNNKNKEQKKKEKKDEKKEENKEEKKEENKEEKKEENKEEKKEENKEEKKIGK
jgi:leucyl-tRNA synthetase